MSLSPHTAPALNDDDGAPVRDLSHWGSHSGGCETPFQRLAGDWAFPLKMNYSVMIRVFFSHSPMYDDYRRPRRAPATDQSQT